MWYNARIRDRHLDLIGTFSLRDGCVFEPSLCDGEIEGLFNDAYKRQYNILKNNIKHLADGFIGSNPILSRPIALAEEWAGYGNENLETVQNAVASIKPPQKIAEFAGEISVGESGYIRQN